ncbi:MAG: glycosyltransferase family 2 protein [Burkholderiaceae bacterium]
MSGLAVIEILLLVAVLVLAVPAFVFFVEVMAALWPSSPGAPDAMGRGGASRPRIAVLIPAHDEAAGIGRTIANVRAQLMPADMLLVVADNCSDDTAAVAAAAGAIVVERHDPDRRGKGYALDFGVRALGEDPPDCLLIVDADCLLSAGSIERLARVSVDADRPAQALYLCHVPEGITRVGARIAEFAFIVKNHVRPRGLAALGLPCTLTGTGMAFPWSLIANVPLASGDLAEDMMLGSELAVRGHAPVFVEAARVDSEFPGSEEGGQGQRRRWEHGHLQTIMAHVPRMLRAAVTRRNWQLLASALDLAVPPLALLVSLQGLLTIVSAGFAFAGGGLAPLTVALLAFAALAVAGLSAWFAHGRHVLSGAMLWLAPVYALRKLPLYVGYLFARQSTWLRTRRDGE